MHLMLAVVALCATAIVTLDVHIVTYVLTHTLSLRLLLYSPTTTHTQCSNLAASSASSASSTTGSSASPAQQQQQQLVLTNTPATAATAGVAAATSSSDNSSRSTRNAGVSPAQRAFNPTEAALRLQALQEQQLLEIAAQERALKERQAQEKKAKAGDVSARGNNGHVQQTEVFSCSRQ
jgi:hypothetical protein